NQPLAVSRTIERTIVKDDEAVIEAAADVQLKANPQIEAGAEPGQRVLGRIVHQPSVADDLRRLPWFLRLSLTWGKGQRQKTHQHEALMNAHTIPPPGPT